MRALFNNKASLLIIGLGFLGAGIIYWTIPYGQVDMLGRQFTFKWSITAIVVGIIASSFMKKNPLPASLLTTTGFAAAVMARVIYDTTIDPTSHNLWPFEVLVAILVSFPTSLIGAAIHYFLMKRNNPT